MPEFATKKRTTAHAPVRRPDRAMHAGQCTICRHPQRAEIDRAFLDWRSPLEIAREYGLGSRTTIYRHAHALGLFERRSHTLRFALGRLIEQVGDVKPTAGNIVSAIRLMMKLNTQDKWTEGTDNSEVGDTPGGPPPEGRENLPTSVVADGEVETGEDGSESPAQPPAAPAALPVRDREAKSPPAARAKPPHTKGDGEAKNPDEEDEYNGPPIAFAENLGPRRRFFWR